MFERRLLHMYIIGRGWGELTGVNKRGIIIILRAVA
jgi:hypothetical protein